MTVNQQEHGTPAPSARGRCQQLIALFLHVAGLAGGYHGVRNVHGEYHGRVLFVYSCGSGDVRHGNYGSYNAHGQRDGYFGSYTYGRKNPGEVWYNNGIPQ